MRPRPRPLVLHCCRRHEATVEGDLDGSLVREATSCICRRDLPARVVGLPRPAARGRTPLGTKQRGEGDLWKTADAGCAG